MMTNHRFQLFAIAFGISSLLGAGAAQAQRAATAAAPHFSAMRARPLSMSGPTVTRARSRGSSTVPRRAPSQVSSNDFFGGGSFFSVGDLLNPYPPPGFDFGFLNAMNQDLGIKAVIDPATEWRLAVAEQVLRSTGFAGSGYYLLNGGGAYAAPVESEEGETEAEQPAQQAPQQPAQQPQVIVVQAPPTSAPSVAAAQPTPEESAPLPDVGQFVLVLRNGTHIQAVAFTRKNDRIVYITADGLRRTVALADVDTQSTVRINEERGTPIQL
jgi:hypothetical protein